MSLLTSTLSIELLVRGRRCVVAGCGPEIPGKIKRLLDSGAVVTWFADESAEPAEVDRVRAAGGQVQLRECQLSDLDGALLAYVATERAEFARAGIDSNVCPLISCVDRPEHSTFISPATASVEGLRVAISSGGVAPGLIRQLRTDLERILSDARLTELLRRAAALRPTLARGERANVMGKMFRGVTLRGELDFSSPD